MKHFNPTGLPAKRFRNHPPKGSKRKGNYYPSTVESLRNSGIPVWTRSSQIPPEGITFSHAKKIGQPIEGRLIGYWLQRNTHLVPIYDGIPF